MEEFCCSLLTYHFHVFVFWMSTKIMANSASENIPRAYSSVEPSHGQIFSGAIPQCLLCGISLIICHCCTPTTISSCVPRQPWESRLPAPLRNTCLTSFLRSRGIFNAKEAHATIVYPHSWPVVYCPRVWSCVLPFTILSKLPKRPNMVIKPLWALVLVFVLQPS